MIYLVASQDRMLIIDCYVISRKNPGNKKSLKLRKKDTALCSTETNHYEIANAEILHEH